MGAKGRPCAPEAAEAVCRARDTWLFVAAVVSAAAVLAVMAWPMVHGRLYTMNDLAHYHLPMRAYYAKCLAEGLDFNWIPNIHCGYYLQGDGQVGMYHPLHRLLYSHLSLTAAFNIELFLSYPLMLGGMYFFLRRWKLGRGASAFGALAFAFSGFNLMHFMHMQAVAIVAHIPWFLFAADAALRGGRRTAIAANLAVALIVASAALLGYPQYLWFMLVTGALYALLVVTLWTRASRGGWLASAVVAGLLIGAVQIMPTYDLLAARRPGAKVHSPFSVMLAPANLVQLVAPFLFEGRVVSTEKSVMTQERALYDGAGVLVLFLLTASGALRAGDKRRLAVGACVLTALGFLLAMGRDGVLYRYVAELPLVGVFRAPARYVLFVHLGMAVAAAVALDAIVASRAWSKRRTIAVLVGVPCAAAAVVLAAGWPELGPGRWWPMLAGHVEKDFRLVAAGAILAASAALLVFAAMRGMRWALPALVVFVAADQAYYGLSYIRTKPAQTLDEVVASIRVPASTASSRIALATENSDLATMRGAYFANGYVGIDPGKYLDYTRKEVLRVASTGYILEEDNKPGSQTRCDDEYYSVTQLDAPMPRARLLSRTAVIYRPGKVLHTIDLATTVTMPMALDLEPGAPGTATVARDLPGDVVVDAEAPSRQMLVVSESYHQGWRATVDGRPAETLPAYADFIGVVLEKGRHRVTLRFDPWSLRWGKAVSLVALCLTLAAFAVALGKTRRTQGPQSDIMA